MLGCWNGEPKPEEINVNIQIFLQLAQDISLRKFHFHGDTFGPEHWIKVALLRKLAKINALAHKLRPLDATFLVLVILLELFGVNSVLASSSVDDVNHQCYNACHLKAVEVRCMWITTG